MERERKARAATRIPAEYVIAVRWTDETGSQKSKEAHGVDLSRSGARFQLREPIRVGTPVLVDAHQYNVRGTGSVRHCTRRGNFFTIGVLFDPEASSTVRLPPAPLVDYYEVLQISPNADQSTVQRVYKILAARFHPDNTESGDAARFRQLAEAYEVLGDEDQRASYDMNYARFELKPAAIFELKDFVDDVTGERNRRLGILSLLYNQRRRRPDSPGLSVLQLETVMALPRELLSFALWYLNEKGYIAPTDNSDLGLTAEGADYLESVTPTNPLVARMLGPGKEPGPGLEALAAAATPGVTMPRPS
jgi:hypothetical protein